ncbi:WW domain-binding protein 4-like [Saccoglossus kowalevskii]|uniref:WW domain-binding protein 4-like n=1 Tax=Saccoglossus kowalevskii TaxID=10224 RepID=A0ABM0M6D9_SACKO|nr:PREDICTED: WW domain-binding protein 4-like [Saccoglossus kowalevskii]
MSEYWKSQPKKFCEFCKCWITDNKPSVDFHERGKRHKENVQKKIVDVQKKGAKKVKQDAKFKSDLQAMEEAALKAFEKDVANDPTLAPQYKTALIQKKIKEAKDAEEIPQEQQPQLPVVVQADSSAAWLEGVSPEGDTYYWNSVTGVSQWDKPDGFVSSAENKVETEVTKKIATDMPKGEENNKQVDISTAKVKTPENKVDAEDDKAKVNAETSGKKRSNPYGSWQEVAPATDDTTDLQLPEARVNYIAPPITLPVDEPRKFKFKEKTVSSLSMPSDGANTGFKKRKLGGNRNIKKREES